MLDLDTDAGQDAGLEGSAVGGRGRVAPGQKIPPNQRCQVQPETGTGKDLQDLLTSLQSISKTQGPP